MLNRAARYFPILKELKTHLPPGGKVVEIGSGSIGIGEFWSHPFVGCELKFDPPPVPPMLPVIGSAAALPFPDQYFDASVASDVMEHIPPDLRDQVVSEIFRVTRTIAIIGYPSGQGAWESDKELHKHYVSRKLPPPVWLQEHMLSPFPDEHLFHTVPPGWDKKVINNESLRFHSWMMRTEMHTLWNKVFRRTLRHAPGLVRWSLQYANGEPYYRQIFVFTRA